MTRRRGYTGGCSKARAPVGSPSLASLTRRKEGLVSYPSSQQPDRRKQSVIHPGSKKSMFLKSARLVPLPLRVTGAIICPSCGGRWAGWSGSLAWKASKAGGLINSPSFPGSDLVDGLLAALVGCRLCMARFIDFLLLFHDCEVLEVPYI